MLTNNQISYLPYDDYAQSANTLFHFMKKQEYLNSILRRRAIIPRYCVETIDYLSIKNGTRLFNEVAILQKCFCDIPFHKLADSFAVNGVGDVYESLSKDERADLEKNNTHFAYYGEYAVAFSKSWGEKKHLQPVHYPMYISFSAFETSEEAKRELDTILQHEEIYVNALTSNAYINQYYEE